MVALARGLNVGALNRNNFVITLLVVGTVIAFFFIPEIVGFQKSLGRGQSKPKPVPQVEVTESLPMVSGEVIREPITGPEPTRSRERESIFTQITKFFSFGKTKRESESQTASQTSSDVATSQGVAGRAGSSTKSSSGLDVSLAEPKITWGVIRSPESQAALKRAQGDAAALVQDIPKNRVRTRYALYNYANGIGFLLGGKEQTMAAIEAIQYLENLDLEVTRAMFSEGIDRTDYIRWTEITIGRDLEASRLARTKKQYKMGFNPRLHLDWVAFRQPANRQHRYDPREPAYVDFRGFVVGKDVKRALLFLDGSLKRNLALSAPDEETGRRVFETKVLPGRGVYTIKVEDKFGERYEKHYSFFEKAKAYRWNPKNGAFALPFHYTQSDVKADKLFKFVGGGRTSDTDSAGFVTF